MGPVRVVVIDVVDGKLVELVAVPDDGAVEEFASQGADPAFGERGSPRGCVQVS